MFKWFARLNICRNQIMTSKYLPSYLYFDIHARMIFHKLDEFANKAKVKPSRKFLILKYKITPWKQPFWSRDYAMVNVSYY